MTTYNFQHLDQSLDEQQTALTTIENSLQFLKQIRANQKRQLYTADQALDSLARELKEATKLIELQHKTIAALEQELMLRDTCPLHRFKAWVGNFKCHVAMDKPNHDET